MSNDEQPKICVKYAKKKPVPIEKADLWECTECGNPFPHGNYESITPANFMCFKCMEAIANGAEPRGVTSPEEIEIRKSICKKRFRKHPAKDTKSVKPFPKKSEQKPTKKPVQRPIQNNAPVQNNDDFLVSLTEMNAMVSDMFTEAEVMIPFSMIITALRNQFPQDNRVNIIENLGKSIRKSMK